MSKLEKVNSVDIADAIRLGCRTMQSVFNADDSSVPFFQSTVRPKPALSFSAHFSEAHVPGRHLNALLNAENAAGVEVDENAVENHRRAILLSYSGPVALPLNRETIDGPPVNFCPHNLRDVSFIKNQPNPYGVDGLRDVANRHLGAFGFPAPYGHESAGKGKGRLSFNMDIVGGVVGSLCEAYRTVTLCEPTGLWVNLLFDRETSAIRVQSPYTHDCLCVEPKQCGPLFVRMPPWLNREAINIEGNASMPVWTNSYLFFDKALPGQAIHLRFPLKEMQVTLPERLHIHPIRVKMRGDAVVAMDNFGADLTFFDPYE